MPKVEVTAEELKAVRRLQEMYRRQGINKPQKECLAEVLAQRRSGDVDIFEGLLDNVKGWRFP